MTRGDFASPFLAGIALALLQRAGASEVTVVHSDPQVSYGSAVADAWYKQNNTCSGGAGFSFTNIQPSWATLSFEGTAIQAYILKYSNACVVYVMVDDVLQTSYEGVDTYQPNTVSFDCVPWIFQKSNLEWGKHNITIVNVGNGKDYIALHKFVYTVPDNPPPSPSSTQTSGESGLNGGLIGGTVGGALGGLILGALIYLFIFYRKRRSNQPLTGIINEVDHHNEVPAVSGRTLAANQVTSVYQPSTSYSYLPLPQPPQSSLYLQDGGGDVPSTVFTPQELEIIRSLSQRRDVPGTTVDAFIARILAGRGQVPSSTGTTGGGPSAASTTNSAQPP